MTAGQAVRPGRPRPLSALRRQSPLAALRRQSPLAALRRQSPLAALRRHWALVALLVVGALARAVVTWTYVPALAFFDTVDYLRAADLGEPMVHRPYGYSAFLQLADAVSPDRMSVRAAAVLQHGLGLGLVVLVYALLQRRGVGRLLSALAVAPLALDTYVIDIEHFLLAETLFMVLLGAAVAVLLWRERVGWLAATGAGALLAAAALTRTVGMFVVAAFGLYLLVRVLSRTARWTALASFALAVLVVVVPYVAWFHSHHGTWSTTAYSGHFLYGRVATFAECERLDVPADLRPLCPAPPVDQRRNIDFYVWDLESPAQTTQASEEDLRRFARLVIAGQPWDYARTTLARTGRYFLPGRTPGPGDTCSGYWRFPVPPPYTECFGRLAMQGFDLEPIYFGMRPDVARVLREIQQVVWTPGPVLALAVVVAVAGAVWPGGRPGLRDRLDPLLLAGTGVLLVFVASATSSFDYRYGLPMLVVVPPAAALALTRARRTGGRSAPSPDTVQKPGEPSRLAPVAARRSPGLPGTPR